MLGMSLEFNTPIEKRRKKKNTLSVVRKTVDEF